MKISQIIFRPFRPEDVEDVLKIASSRFKEKYSSSLILQIYNYFPEGFLVAELEGEIVGYITAVPHYPTSLRVLMVAVKREHEGRGIGSQLMGRIETLAYMKGYSSVKLEVRQDNIRAIGFYRSRGYRTVGMIEHYYSDGSDAFIMEKPLNF
ncbi:MAG: ribosomal-protein-alanine N-acetyltransferase [Thermoplasmata archaeon]|nr:MAG: ribosomal-protein-alanine N-acetyltransferase [Thermoplasmata archaeon]